MPRRSPAACAERKRKDRTFRRDLFYRLAHVRVEVPPLRERPEDVPRLAQHFAAGRPISGDALRALLGYEWPGNVRELRSICERRVLAARRGGGTMAEAIRMDQHLDDVPDTLREAVAAFVVEEATPALAGNQRGQAYKWQTVDQQG